VDIVQFAQNIEAIVRIEAAREEHRRCVNLMERHILRMGLEVQSPQFSAALFLFRAGS
jgi:hypothetical protein